MGGASYHRCRGHGRCPAKGPTAPDAMLAVGLNHSIPTNAQVIRETLNKTFEEIN